MTRLRVLFSRLRTLVRTRRRDTDLDEEIETHLTLLADEQIRRGVPPDAARAAAKAAFGGVAQVKETYRDQRGLPFLETLMQDLRFGIRILWRNPAFTAVVVLTLGLGIGANTAIFSLVDALMLRRLPVTRPEELVRLSSISPRNTDTNFSYSAFQQFRAGSARVADVMAASATRSIRATVDGEAEVLNRKMVSGNYFSVLGVPSVAGRTFTAGDDDFAASPPAAVLGHRYWTRRFGQDAGAMGRTITIAATVFTIVGVAAPEFRSETVGELPDVWTPLTIQPDAPAYLWIGHSTTWLRIIARRRPAITLDETRAAFEPAFAAIVRERAAAEKIASFREHALQSMLGLDDGSRGLSPVRDNLSGPLYLLMAVVLFVLLIACANVANLLLARAAVRAREISLRAALGAGRLRLVRQLLVEAVLLAVFGGALGLLLGHWGATSLVTLASRTPLPLRLDVRLDLRMLAFTAGLSAITAVVFGLVPAVRAARPNLLPALKGPLGWRIGTGGFRLGKSLVVAQIALSLGLLVIAGLFVRSLVNLRNLDLGFNPARVLVLNLDMSSSAAKVPLEERRNIYERLVERAESLPGVRAASLSASGVFSGSSWGNRITVEGRTAPEEEPERTLANSVTPGFFDVMEIRLLRGRPFSDADRQNAPPVAIVNETFAQQFFNNPAPIGRKVGLGAPAETMREIVGVVGNAKYSNMREPAVPMLYVPFRQHDGRLGELQVRMAADPAALAAQVRRALASVDQRISVTGVVEMQEQVDASILAETLIAKLSGLFGSLALLLSAVGLYGVIAYMSSQRTTEIGIRMALGADRRSVLWLILRQVLTLVLVGMIVGAPAAFFVGQLVRRQLYGLPPHDPFTITLAVVVLSGVALVAGILPARRASRINPIAAVRAE